MKMVIGKRKNNVSIISYHNLYSYFDTKLEQFSEVVNLTKILEIIHDIMVEVKE